MHVFCTLTKLYFQLINKSSSSSSSSSIHPGYTHPLGESGIHGEGHPQLSDRLGYWKPFRERRQVQRLVSYIISKSQR